MLPDVDDDEEGDAGLNFWEETTVEPPDTAKLEGLAREPTEGICDLLTEVATELYGIETAELRTRDGTPRNGETDLSDEVFDLTSVGESVVRTGEWDNGETVLVVGVVGDDNELKNAALAALFWLDISDNDLSAFSDLDPELLFWLDISNANLSDLSEAPTLPPFWLDESKDDFSALSDLELDPDFCFKDCDTELTGNMAGSDLNSTDLWLLIVLSLDSSNVDELWPFEGSVLGDTVLTSDMTGYDIDGEVCDESFDVVGCEVARFKFFGVDVDIGWTNDMTDEVSDCCLGDVVMATLVKGEWIPAGPGSPELEAAPEDFKALLAISKLLPNRKASCWVVIFFFLCLADSAA